MRDGNLIPFGIKNDTGSIIDIFDAEQGNDCDCKCPSCNTPLQARKGDDRAWHFAHQSSSAFKQTSKECAYSYFVSVRLMIKQLAEKSFSLLTPSFESAYVSHHPLLGYKITTPLHVATPTLLYVKKARLEESFLGYITDFVFSVGEYDVVVIVSYEGRPFPLIAHSDVPDNIGIVNIDVSEMPNLFVESKSQGNSYLSVLKKYLQESEIGKSWYHHPRYRTAVSAIKSTFSHHEEATIKEYQCKMCQRFWKGNVHLIQNCPHCKTHLYVRAI